MPSKSNRFPERVIVNKNCVNTESCNWKNDYHRYAGWSYADIVKGKTHGVFDVSTSMNVTERSNSIDHSKSINTVSNTCICPASTQNRHYEVVNKSNNKRTTTDGNESKVTTVVRGTIGDSNCKLSYKVGTNRTKVIKNCVHDQRENGVPSGKPSHRSGHNCTENRFWPLLKGEFQEAHQETTIPKIHSNTSVSPKNRTNQTQHHSLVQTTSATKVGRDIPQLVSCVRPAVEKIPLQAEDKYDLELRFPAHHRQTISQASNVSLFNQWNV